MAIAVPVTMAAARPALAAEPNNAGDHQATTTLPFKVTEVATFDYPWAIAPLADGRSLITEKPGALYIVDKNGRKTKISGTPDVEYSGQNGMLDVAPAPDFAQSRQIYLTFVEPGKGGSGLALSRATLVEAGGTARLADFKVLWRQEPKGKGGQPGGIIAFAPDGKHLFLSSGDRQRPATAQDMTTAAGKILRLNLDGTTPPDNPLAKQGGVQAQFWSWGHRNPYGLAFAPDGTLWEHEMGPRGGDELNRIEAGKNYGWALVSNGDNYSGSAIPRHSTRPDLEAPVLYWNPVIAPAGLVFYDATLFAQWRGSALIGGLSSMSLNRITFDGKAKAQEVDRFQMDNRIRDVAVDRDGAILVIEDDSSGRLLRLTPQ